ncbi:MAG: hypothetical protein EOO28_18400 [Comamonadaceae bacterium]|nr:MAG: hypothetical protein EOO28_18400 [Comamonadaceae bacterium]
MTSRHFYTALITTLAALVWFDGAAAQTVDLEKKPQAQTSKARPAASATGATDNKTEQGKRVTGAPGSSSGKTTGSGKSTDSSAGMGNATGLASGDSSAARQVSPGAGSGGTGGTKSTAPDGAGVGGARSGQMRTPAAAQ